MVVPFARHASEQGDRTPEWVPVRQVGSEEPNALRWRIDLLFVHTFVRLES